MEKIINTIEAVKCYKCSKLYEIESHDYISIMGNILIGSGGGIIGDNFDDNGKLRNTTVICRGNCLKELFEQLKSDSIIR